LPIKLEQNSSRILRHQFDRTGRVIEIAL